MNGDAQLMSSDNHCDTALRLFMIGETTVRKQSRRKELRRQRERESHSGLGAGGEVVGLSALRGVPRQALH